MFSNVADIGSQIKAGKVRALAVTAQRRAATLPEVPTMAEAGLPDFIVTSWFGLLVPAGTPAPIVARLNAETVKVLGRAEVKATLAQQGLEVASSSPEAFAAHIKSEIARFTQIARAAGIKAE
jgi:tripartite-type tricarboxylate transporter receptor subunit TctC